MSPEMKTTVNVTLFVVVMAAALYELVVTL